MADRPQSYFSNWSKGSGLSYGGMAAEMHCEGCQRRRDLYRGGDGRLYCGVCLEAHRPAEAVAP